MELVEVLAGGFSRGPARGSAKGFPWDFPGTCQRTFQGMARGFSRDWPEDLLAGFTDCLFLHRHSFVPPFFTVVSSFAVFIRSLPWVSEGSAAMTTWVAALVRFNAFRRF